ncbi:MAG: hypothetical protein M1821_009262 [Bathelium mastoideum]|nr:MAG: hypothetical protein M1821_009262 [Bathelium mastoideum]
MADLQDQDGQGDIGEERTDHKSDLLVQKARNKEKLLDEPETNGSQDDALENKSEHDEADEDEADEDDATHLAKLTANVRDQDDLERDIGRQADQLLVEQADERDNKRLEKTLQERERHLANIRRLEQRLLQPGGSSIKTKLRAEVANAQDRITELNTDVEQIQRRIESRHKDDAQDGDPDSQKDAGNKRMPGESQREFLIRTGKITPFSKMGRNLVKASSDLAEVMLDAEEEEEETEGGERGDTQGAGASEEPRSHRNLMKPGFAEEDEMSRERPAKRRRISETRSQGVDTVDSAVSSEDQLDEAFAPDSTDQVVSEDEEISVEDEEDDFMPDTTPPPKKGNAKRKQPTHDDEREDLAGVDDGNERLYQQRLQSWVRRRSAARERIKAKMDAIPVEQQVGPSETNAQDSDIDDGSPSIEAEEWYLPHPTRTDTELEGGFRIPGDIYPSLFDYQKTGVQWLWELFSQEVGGIIGDEMGLGKTIQVISFLAGLHYSKKLKKPIIVVCPATVMKQWVNEFHRWWPPLRVSILHSSGSGMIDIGRERQIEDELEHRAYTEASQKLSKGERVAKKVVDRVVEDGHVLVTTYSGLQTYARLLIPVDWEYAVLDEGHKIRNPNTAITVYCKELRTANRVILSGTPMQNNLTELWSLFDFVFPMRLGTLVNFRNQFEIPIKQGGYANASNLQVETAMRCAETLKDTISPYLLQRFKIDVAADLPKKSERVLFCKLTKLQRDAYERFLKSDEMNAIMVGKRQALYGVDILRKICNHPDLQDHKILAHRPGYNYGSGVKSGKMQVVKALLEIWKKGGHKTLLFAQHRIMLDILERFIRGIEGFNYRRMDGNTSIKDRQDLVDEFNRSPDLHVFLLTTKVGGLGVNLTGADRVIIFDPDWNPSTDVQARERAWRLGQKREVEIYRLMTAGTIEEKIYHRQIFKQFLTNKILKDPKQRQTFQLRDLHDLFTLGSQDEEQTETSALFKGTEVDLSTNDPNLTPADEHGIPTPPTDTESKPPASTLPTITGISREEAYASADPAPPITTTTTDPSSTLTSTSTEPPPSNKDNRLLTTLFARSAVHSALEHDAIIDGVSSSSRPKLTADPAIIAAEARRVAADAARELQRAAELARQVPVGTPTWTGLVGEAGRPVERASVRGGGMVGRGGRGGGGMRGGPSSAAVMAGLAARGAGAGAVSAAAARAAVGSGASSRASTPGSGAGVAQQQPRGKDFLAMIRDYLLAHGGKVYTQMLIDHFNRYCGTEQRTAEFREMLKRIAVLARGGRGRGRWVLKREFGGTG